MHLLHNIIIMGDKCVGKSKLIKYIRNGNKVTDKVPIFGENNHFIMINNKIYCYNNCMSLFQKWKIGENIIMIVLDSTIRSSFVSIEEWIEKAKKKYSQSNIYLILWNTVSCAMQDLHHLTYLCVLNNLKLVRM